MHDYIFLGNIAPLQLGLDSHRDHSNSNLNSSSK